MDMEFEYDQWQDCHGMEHDVQDEFTPHSLEHAHIPMVDYESYEHFSMETNQNETPMAFPEVDGTPLFNTHNFPPIHEVPSNPHMHSPHPYYPTTHSSNYSHGYPTVSNAGMATICSDPSNVGFAPSQEEWHHYMSQSAFIESYMQFLSKQHSGPIGGSPIDTLKPSSKLRSRSSSNPSAAAPQTTTERTTITSSLPKEMAFEAAALAREKKLNKYRAKRARRLTTSSNGDGDAQSLGSIFGEYLPASKMPKIHGYDLENRLMYREEECKQLRYELGHRDAELVAMKMALEDQQRQIALLTDSTSNASSSTCTSPRPRSPSLVSSPSSRSIGSSMDTEGYLTPSLDSSSVTSDLDTHEAFMTRQEKLKKLGGRPSDVYYPWWNGVSLNHPAFQQKEDWSSVELRTQQDVLARERLDYLLRQQKWKVEQQRAAELHTHGSGMAPSSPTVTSPETLSTSMLPPSSHSAPHNPHIQSMLPHTPPHTPPQHLQTPVSPNSSHPYTHHPPSFYQSPHQSHLQIKTAPVHNGYWSGNFVPAAAEPIDFSKISLRKTQTPPPLVSNIHASMPISNGNVSVSSSKPYPQAPKPQYMPAKIHHSSVHHPLPDHPSMMANHSNNSAPTKTTPTKYPATQMTSPQVQTAVTSPGASRLTLKFKRSVPPSTRP